MSRPKHQNRAPSAHRKTQVSSVSRAKKTTTEKNASSQGVSRSIKTVTSDKVETKNIRVEAKNAEVEVKIAEVAAKDAEVETRNIKAEAKITEVEAKNARQFAEPKNNTKVAIQSDKNAPESIEIKKPAPKNIADQAEEHALSSIINSLDKLTLEKKVPFDPSTTKFKPQVKSAKDISKSNPPAEIKITRQASTLNVKVTEAEQTEIKVQPAVALKKEETIATEAKASPAKKVFTVPSNKFQPVITQAPRSKPVVTQTAQSKPIATQFFQPEPVVTQTPRIAASILKQEAIEKAVQATNSHINNSNRKQSKQKLSKTGFGWQRLLLTFSCALIITFAVAYFINLRQSDLSLQVAAMRTGIDASYPSYTPRDFSLTDITSEDGKITMNFRNYDTNTTYALIEEKSTWDSNALYNNYVKEYYGNDYTTVREQGLTIYIDGRETAWVNGGIFYRIQIGSGTLTKKQITTIATSL